MPEQQRPSRWTIPIYLHFDVGVSPKVVVHDKRRRLIKVLVNGRFGLFLGVPRPDRVTVHHEPQVGDEPLEEDPKADKDRVNVQGERIEALDRLQCIFIPCVIRFQVHRRHGGGV